MFRYENEFCALRVGGRNALTADAPTAAILFFGAEKPESRSGERRKAPPRPRRRPAERSRRAFR